MHLREVKKIIIALLMTGFVIGILYLNIFAKSAVMRIGIFNEAFIKEYSVNKINTLNYMLYIARCRLIPLAVVLVVTVTKWKKILATIVLLWTGFQCGMLLTASILAQGLKGLVLCLIGVLPHFIGYFVVYAMLMVYLFGYPGIKWDYTKTFMLILFLLLGIITECYINPVLMDIFITVFW